MANNFNHDTGWWTTDIKSPMSQRIFLIYGKEIFNANALAPTLQEMNAQVKLRAKSIQSGARAKQLENFLNEAYKQASLQGMIKDMGDQLVDTMMNGVVTGMTMANAGIGFQGGLTGRSIGAGAKQALAVYQYGKQHGKKYTNPTGAILQGSVNEQYSSKWFMNQLNTGQMTEQQVLNIKQGYDKLNQFNGEMLERFIQMAGNAGVAIGQEVAEEAIDKVLNEIQSNINKGTIGKFKTLGSGQRSLTTVIEGNVARVFDSAQKVDATMNLQFSDSEGMEQITLSAKSRSTASTEIQLLDRGNLLGLLTNAGVGVGKETYSALTIYTNNDVGPLLDTLGKTIFMQALAGTTGENGKQDQWDSTRTVFDQADYMVYQVGSANSTAPFRVVSVYESYVTMFANNDADFKKYVRVKYEPSPPPIGSNTQGLNEKYDPPPRTEATITALQNATVSVFFRQSYMKSLYS